MLLWRHLRGKILLNWAALSRAELNCQNGLNQQLRPVLRMRNHLKTTREFFCSEFVVQNSELSKNVTQDIDGVPLSVFNHLPHGNGSVLGH